MLNKVEVPQFGMVQIGEPAIDQAANVVERQGRMLIGPQQQLGIGRTGLGGEGRAVHEVTAIAGQRHAITRFGVGRAGFRILTGKSPHADYPLVPPENQNQAHLQQDFQFAGDGSGLTVVKPLTTIAALEQETPTACASANCVLSVSTSPLVTKGGNSASSTCACRNKSRLG